MTASGRSVLGLGTGQDRTGQDRIREISIGPRDRTGQDRMREISLGSRDRTGQDRTA